MSQGAPGKRRSKYVHRPKGPVPIVVDDTTADRILRGAKTQHRYGSDKRCRYEVHQEIPVRRKDGSLVCHVQITGRYNQLPGDITDVEAKAEGFKDRAEFHDERTFRARQVWVLCFEVCETRYYMHRNPAAAQSDYTHLPADGIRGEDQGVEPAEVERLTALPREHFDLLRERQWLYNQHERLLSAGEEALANGVDITRQRKAIERQLQVIESKTRRRAA